MQINLLLATRNPKMPPMLSHIIYVVAWPFSFFCHTTIGCYIHLDLGLSNFCYLEAGASMEQFDMSLYAHAILEGLKQYPPSTRFSKSNLPLVFTEILSNSGLFPKSGQHSSTILFATSGTSSWFFDSTCCNHMTLDPHIFSTKTSDSFTPAIHTADGSQIQVTHTGHISTSYLKLDLCWTIM